MYLHNTDRAEESFAISYTHIVPPLGKLIACGSEKGICFLGFDDQKHIEKTLAHLEKQLHIRVKTDTHPLFQLLKEQLDAYFARKLKEFSLPLHFVGTDFQKQVWHQLQTIPYGQTLSYKEQALSIGKPKSVRAVAYANAKNPLTILVPCHRVIAHNGQLTGYSGGLWRKKYLLELEQPL